MGLELPFVMLTAYEGEPWIPSRCVKGVGAS